MSTQDVTAGEPQDVGRPRYAGRLEDARATLLRVGGLVGAIVVVMAIFTYRSDGTMVDRANLLGITRALSTVAIMGLGLLVVVIAGEIDLSFANLYGLSTNIVAVLWVTHSVSVYLAIPIAFGVAIFVGCFNAFFTAVVGIPSFIATLGSSTLIFGITLYIGKTNSFSPAYPANGKAKPAGELSFFHDLAQTHLPGKVPMQTLWTLVLLVVFGFLLGRTIFGFRLKAIGGNRAAATLARLPSTKYVFMVFVISAVMACLAGILDFSFVGSAGPNDGQSNLFPVFAAVIIGGASLSGGRGTVIGTLFGALLLATLNNGLALEGAGPFAQQTLLGTVTILAVVLDRFTSSRGAAR
jgi:ribose/xylose/arabinose/galactoside ABC-type transport system permease subunit